MRQAVGTPARAIVKCEQTTENKTTSSPNYILMYLRVFIVYLVLRPCGSPVCRIWPLTSQRYRASFPTPKWHLSGTAWSLRSPASVVCTADRSLKLYTWKHAMKSQYRWDRHSVKVKENANLQSCKCTVNISELVYIFMMIRSGLRF